MAPHHGRTSLHGVSQDPTGHRSHEAGARGAGRASLAMPKVKIGIVGSRFQADCIATSVRMMPDEAEVVAVASPSPGHAEAFVRRHGIPDFYVDYRDMLCDT